MFVSGQYLTSDCYVNYGRSLVRERHSTKENNTGTSVELDPIVFIIET